ncbi:hypothetical protein BSLA_02f0088 [Burkholderia stabilis]|nr:hypothetical protein BSLA_02f0088 [Burkholderia stabilis]
MSEKMTHSHCETRKKMPGKSAEVALPVGRCGAVSGFDHH